jgi:hypothetical protein
MGAVERVPVNLAYGTMITNGLYLVKTVMSEK